MKWWHEAKFGMFIHWGLYSTLGRHEWVMENEGIPAKEYEQYANNFRPKPNFATAWAQLAKRAGARVISVPVNHRPRARGTSKYGMLDRLWVGIVDLFGVMWLRRRFKAGLTVREE